MRQDGTISLTNRMCGSDVSAPSRVVTRRRRPSDMGTVSIPLTQGKCALIDEEDLALVSQYKWSAIKKGLTWYARAYSPERWRLERKRDIYMHRLFLGFPACQVDHRDRDGLNNTRQNIREATAKENRRNTPPRSTNTSGFKGVTWSKKVHRWQAQIDCRFLGYFDSLEDAAHAFDAAARELYGEFAWCNFPEVGG